MMQAELEIKEIFIEFISLNFQFILKSCHPK